jgi:c-di-GMP-binding flagellar brake protein YcgR
MRAERRRRKRVEYRVEIQYAFEGEWHRAKSVNISMSGLLLEVDRELRIGEFGKIRIVKDSLKEDALVAANVEVVRSEAGESANETREVALRFTRMDFESSVNLFQVIRYNSDGEWWVG